MAARNGAQHGRMDALGGIPSTVPRYAADYSHCCSVGIVLMPPRLRIRELRVVRNGLKTKELNYWFFCPGCDEAHRYAVNAPPPEPSWTFNGDFDNPTFTPSLLLRSTRGPENTPHRCHLFLTNGILKFCGDCTHHLSGQSTPLPALPDWLQPARWPEL